MATEKNITMKQFNGTDYDTLYPKTIASQIPDVYSKTDIITTETLSQLGLSADKLPNDAFQQIKTLIDNAQASADGKAKIQTGSYVGTGTSVGTQSSPMKLTFDFAPKLVIVNLAETTSGTQKDAIILIRDTSQYIVISYGGVNYYTECEWTDNSVSWWYKNGTSTANVCNTSGSKYVWVAFG